MSETGKRIKARRKALGISADKLAELLGVSRSTIFRYENGEIDKVPGDIMKPLAKALCTTPAYLMGWDDTLDKETDFIATMMKNTVLVEHVKLLVNLDENNQKSVFDMIEFLSRRTGL